MESGECPRGDNCRYAHGKEELRKKPDFNDPIHSHYFGLEKENLRLKNQIKQLQNLVSAYEEQFRRRDGSQQQNQNQQQQFPPSSGGRPSHINSPQLRSNRQILNNPAALNSAMRAIGTSISIPMNISNGPLQQNSLMNCIPPELLNAAGFTVIAPEQSAINNHNMIQNHRNNLVMPDLNQPSQQQLQNNQINIPSQSLATVTDPATQLIDINLLNTLTQGLQNQQQQQAVAATPDLQNALLQSELLKLLTGQSQTQHIQVGRRDSMSSDDGDHARKRRKRRRRTRSSSSY